MTPGIKLTVDGRGRPSVLPLVHGDLITLRIDTLVEAVWIRCTLWLVELEIILQGFASVLC